MHACGCEVHVLCELAVPAAACPPRGGGEPEHTVPLDMRSTMAAARRCAVTCAVRSTARAGAGGLGSLADTAAFHSMLFICVHLAPRSAIPFIEHTSTLTSKTQVQAPQRRIA